MEMSSQRFSRATSGYSGSAAAAAAAAAALGGVTANEVNPRLYRSSGATSSLLGGGSKSLLSSISTATTTASGLRGGHDGHHDYVHSTGSHHRLSGDSGLSSLLSSVKQSEPKSFLSSTSDLPTTYSGHSAAALLTNSSILSTLRSTDVPTMSALNHGGHVGMAGGGLTGGSLANRPMTRHRSLGGEVTTSYRSNSPIRNRSISPMPPSASGRHRLAPSNPPPEIIIGSRPASSASLLNRMSTTSNFNALGGGGGHYHDTGGTMTSRQDDEIFNSIRQRILQRGAVDRIASAANLPASITDSLKDIGPSALPSTTTNLLSGLTSDFRPASSATVNNEINYASLLGSANDTADDISKQIRAVKRSIGTETTTADILHRGGKRDHHPDHHHGHHRLTSNGDSDYHHHHHLHRLQADRQQESSRTSRHRNRQDSGDSIVANDHHHCCSHHHHHHNSGGSSAAGGRLFRSNSFGNLREMAAPSEQVATTTKRGRARHQTLAYGVSASDLGVALNMANPATWSTEDFKPVFLTSTAPGAAPATAGPLQPQEDFRQRSRNLRGFNSDMSGMVTVQAATAAAVGIPQQQVVENHGAKMMNHHHHDMVQKLYLFLAFLFLNCTQQKTTYSRYVLANTFLFFSNAPNRGHASSP